MAVKLRLRRMGKKRQPVYKVVAADERSPRDGRFIEALGLYNPKVDPASVEINEERALYWLGVGAIPTDTVKNLLSREGILLKRELIKRGLTEEQVAAEVEKFRKEKEAKLAAIAAKKGSKKVEAKKEEKADNEGASEVKGTASEKAEGEEESKEG